MAWVRAVHDWDWAGAEKEFRRALELNPNYAHGHSWYAWFLTWMGRHGEAIVSAERARRLDPLSLLARMHVGLVLFGARKYDQAIAEWQEVIELDPHFVRANWDLGRAYTQKGMYEDAITQFRKAIATSTGVPGGSAVSEGWLGYAYARAGMRKEALRTINALKERSERMYVSPLNIAMVYTGLGENEEALEWLERAHAVRDVDIVTLKVTPQWDPLRSDPRFQDLLRRMNFPE